MSTLPPPTPQPPDDTADDAPGHARGTRPGRGREMAWTPVLVALALVLYVLASGPLSAILLRCSYPDVCVPAAYP